MYCHAQNTNYLDGFKDFELRILYVSLLPSVLSVQKSSLLHKQMGVNEDSVIQVIFIQKVEAGVVEFVESSTKQQLHINVFKLPHFNLLMQMETVSQAEKTDHPVNHSKIGFCFTSHCFEVLLCLTSLRCGFLVQQRGFGLSVLFKIPLRLYPINYC